MILRNDRGVTVHALRVSQFPSYDAQGVDWLMVAIDPERAFTLLVRMNLFATAQAKDPETVELVFEDASVRFVDEADLYSDLVTPAAGAEACRLVVREGEVFWRAIHPDYDIEITSEPITADELRECAGAMLVRIG